MTLKISTKKEEAKPRHKSSEGSIALSNVIDKDSETYKPKINHESKSSLFEDISFTHEKTNDFMDAK
jgi:hypothetical protein